MIHVDIGSKGFHGRPVLGAISFGMKAGERVAILGPSGVGKSTLLRLVTGLDDDFEGTIERPQRLAMVFQEPNLLPWRSVIANLTLPTGCGNVDAYDALSDVGLQEKADLFPGQLSLGQQRRLSIARAFLAKPDLIVMDEPFASLDDQTHADVLALADRLIEKYAMTVLLVTHSRLEARRLCTRTLQLEGNPAQLV